MSRKHLGGGSRQGELPVPTHRGPEDGTDEGHAGGHRAMSPGARGAKPESEQRGFDGEDQGWAFCPFLEGASGGPLGREGSMVEIVFEGITPTSAITVTTETRSLGTKGEILWKVPSQGDRIVNS